MLVDLDKDLDKEMEETEQPEVYGYIIINYLYTIVIKNIITSNNIYS